MSAKATCGPKSPAIAHIAAGRLVAHAQKCLTGLLGLTAITFTTIASAQSVPCTCRYKGEDFGLGASICMKSPDGLRMATCQMVLNNTSWQVTSTPCPVTGLELQDGPRLQEAPVTAPDTPARRETASLRPAQ